MTWTDLGQWWLDELAADPAYEEVVTPLLLEVLEPVTGRVYLDLGSGEGRVMSAVRAVGAAVHGVELNRELAAHSARVGPTFVARLPELAMVRSGSYHGAYCVLVLEHIVDTREFFDQVARVVRPGGVLALVCNHPIFTAPGSTPVSDPDSEVLWRPGRYFEHGVTLEPAGTGRVAFHHRTMAELLNSAAAAGWSLATMRELPHHDLPDQGGIPRLLACRWRLLP